MNNQKDAAVLDAQQQWDDALDVMGTEANIEQLEAHLRSAPDPEATMPSYLRGNLTARRLAL